MDTVNHDIGVEQSMIRHLNANCKAVTKFMTEISPFDPCYRFNRVVSLVLYQYAYLQFVKHNYNIMIKFAFTYMDN